MKKKKKKLLTLFKFRLWAGKENSPATKSFAPKKNKKQKTKKTQKTKELTAPVQIN